MTEPSCEDRPPTVSVLMPAYNYEQYVGRALQSVLDQDYPADRLGVIVVDDGSTDGTAAVVGALAGANPGRITLIRQANAGPSAAINCALAHADGDLIAVLDADDGWLAQKTRRQADRLATDPELGMVFCDMRVVDAHDRLVRPSQVGRIGTFPRRAFATLLAQNRATQSSIMLRSRLARPVPAGVPYSDWWFALCAAEAGPIAYMPEPLALYREHGTNLTSGVSGAAAVREHTKEVRFQLWALRNLNLSSLSPAEALTVWHGVERHVHRAGVAASTHFIDLATTSTDDCARARQEVAAADDARARGDVALECQLLLTALGWDPYQLPVRDRLVGAVRELRRRGEPSKRFVAAGSHRVGTGPR